MKRMKITDLDKQVATLIQHNLPAGSYTFSWKPGEDVAAGSYVFVLKAGEYRAVRSIVKME